MRLCDHWCHLEGANRPCDGAARAQSFEQGQEWTVIVCWYAYRRGQLAKWRPELQNPIGLTTTYRKISGKNTVHQPAGDNAFDLQTRLYSSNPPRIPTLFIFGGALLASHCLPLCGSDAAVVAQSKIFQVNPSGTRRAFPRHLTVPSSIPARFEGRLLQERAIFAHRAQTCRSPAFPSFFACEVNKPPASRKT
jgi:hypothetical protein